ncbi:hypothetical protein evm_010855 [Chilo suppressalis]|nr:hypothetical protein evm_010855 [Chilo suppressalis]
MEFGVDKCAVMHVKRGKVVNSTNLQFSETITLKSLSVTETYKYLGMSQSLGLTDGDVKQALKERFFWRLTKVLNCLLSGANKVRAFNAWVMPLFTYSFGILRWTQTELDTLDRKVRQLLTVHRMLHPRSSVMRLYIPRKCGGRGLLNAKNLHNREVCSLRNYFLNSEGRLLRDIVAVDKNLTPLSLAKENWRKPRVLSTQDRKEVWKSKELHGRFYRALTGPNVDQLASVNWLRFGDLFGETEGFVCAIADEVMKTNNYRRYILRDGTADICRACRRPGESLRHIVSGCSHLANVLENGHATLYWDRPVITDRTIIANRPDIVLTDRLKRQAVLIDITIPHDENLVKAEKDKLSKYLDLAHEVYKYYGTRGQSNKSSQNTKKVTIRNAVEKIRFLTMTPKQFVDGPAQSTLLTKAEVYAVLMNISSTKSAVPMPCGLSTSRAKRLKNQVIEYESD